MKKFFILAVLTAFTLCSCNKETPEVEVYMPSIEGLTNEYYTFRGRVSEGSTIETPFKESVDEIYYDVNTVSKEFYITDRSRLKDCTKFKVNGNYQKGVATLESAISTKSDSSIMWTTTNLTLKQFVVNMNTIRVVGVDSTDTRYVFYTKF